MSAEVVNLRRVRKARARAEADAQAAANRIAFGRSKAEKAADTQATERRERELDGSRRER